MPVRIQRQRTKGWTMPEGAFYVGRPSIWGNPFIHADAAEAVEAFERLLRGGTQNFEMGPDRLQFAKNAHPKTLHWAYADFVRTFAKQRLAGLDLACWCPLDKPCHADVLLKIANT